MQKIFVWTVVKNTNKKLDEKAPWKNILNRDTIIIETLQSIAEIGYMLTPFLPETAQKILKATAGKITKIEPLFPKKK